MMGSAAAGEALYGKLRAKAQALGHVVSPDDAALALRGLRTLAVRLNQETSSCLEVVKFLSQCTEIANILCPMLAGSPGHELWSRDFTGGCGLFSFVLKGRDEAARGRFIDALELFGIGYSWGGYESLAIPFDPARARSATIWPPTGWDSADRFGVRLSIGLEDPADLIADLERGLAAMGGS
jgi:cystathionine beta-lyase